LYQIQFVQKDGRLMFEFEPTTYEILRYVKVKGDRPAKSVDYTPDLGIGGPGEPATLPNKKTPHYVRGLCYPTWIRTKTNRTRICRTTVILSGNHEKNTPFVKGGGKFTNYLAAGKKEYWGAPHIKTVSLEKDPPSIAAI
jgi:hypothetical protein